MKYTDWLEVFIFFFFYFYDEETDSTVQVPVENVEDFDEHQMYIYLH